MPNKFHLARITLEAVSPLMIASGGDDPLYDVLLARDVNGLPMIPASSLAGVLRHAFDEEQAKEFFGYQNRDEGCASPLIFSDGLFHCSDDQPRDGIVFDRNDLKKDPVAQLALQQGPVTRDHVCLNSYGVVEDHGKFERSAAPAGSRFTFEISQRGDGEALKKVLEIIKNGIWLGGATRSGYGEISCNAFGIEAIDLTENRQRYCDLVQQNLQTRDIAMQQVTKENCKPQGQFCGQIEGPLLIGASSDNPDIDRSYYKEKRIVWNNGEDCIKTVTLIPASSLKGALRHRTLYHLRKHNHSEPEKALDNIFGCAADNDAGYAGILRFSDIVVKDEKLFAMTHVGLDRFTGGSRNGALFTDEMLWRPELKFSIEPLKKFYCDDCRRAFSAALDDLKTGVLGLGADWGDGVGVFESLEVPEFDFQEVGG